MTSPFAKLENVLAGMTPGPWSSEWHGPCHEEGEPTKYCAFGPMHEGDDESDCDDTAMDNAWSDAQGIALLRNLGPLMLDVCKAAEVHLCAQYNYEVLEIELPLRQNVADALFALKDELEKS